MKKANSIFKNVSILTTGEVLSRVLSFIVIILIAKFLGDQGLGKYSFIFAFVSFFAILSDFGVSTYIQKEIAKNKAKTQYYLSQLFPLKVGLALLSILAPVGIILIGNETVDIKTGVILAAIAMGFYYIAYLYRAIANAHELQQYNAAYIIIERVLAFTLSCIALLQGYGVVALVIAFTFSNVVGSMLLYGLVSKNIAKTPLKLQTSHINLILKKSFPYWLTTIFITIYFKIDTIMLGFLQGYEVTGWYNASYKMVEALIAIPVIVTSVLFPVMSRTFAKKRSALNALFKRTFFYLFALSLPIAIGSTLLADRIIYFTYGQEFAPSILVLQVLVWVLCFMFVNYIMGFLLNAIDKQYLFTLVTAISAGVNVLLNLVLIPLYAHIGATVATMITEAIAFGVLIFLTHKYGFSVPYRTLIKPLIAGAIMAAVIVSLSGITLVLLIPLAAATYIGLLFLFKAITRQDKELFTKVVDNK